MNAPQQPDPSLLERASGLRSTEELREAVLAGILQDQLEVVRLQQDVVALISDTDKRFATTVQALREENAKLAGLVGRSEEAFKGELALRAAEHARREFAEATGGVIGRLQDALARIEREAAVSRVRRMAEILVVACGSSILTLAGVWALLHR
ncbi:hypothetical protein [Burkholderia pseudomallei]|uniref:hypothetical protein n=1 Tax=Burkholderia pseudomallei TaxID=28450 RepID=UPI00053653B1|nr:hypothetical protein [Burkholderia pseudomallei]KGV75280.1 hypothetical protein X890_2900 [Burkholderia pseudomallei MSHR4299]KGX18074.1 hypothetical protein X896_2776 [Burkholderia pseudomallei ABCPW 1]